MFQLAFVNLFGAAIDFRRGTPKNAPSSAIVFAVPARVVSTCLPTATGVPYIGAQRAAGFGWIQHITLLLMYVFGIYTNLHTIHVCILALVALAYFLPSVVGVATYDLRGFHTTSSCIPKLMIWQGCLDPRSTNQLSWLLHIEHGRMQFVPLWHACANEIYLESKLAVEVKRFTIWNYPEPWPPANFPSCRCRSPTVAKAWFLPCLTVCLASDWERAHAWRTAMFVFRLGEPCY